MDKPGQGNIDHERLDPLRKGRGPIPEHVIDEFVAGRLSRRDFIRRATAVGIGLPATAAILEACGSSSSSSTTTSSSSPTGSKGKAGATIRAGIAVPTGAIDPITIDDAGGLETLDFVGEWLVFATPSLGYNPWLATSWSPNSDGTVWTFNIRQGVKFNDGTPMTIDDVVYSFKQQSDVKNGGNALSVFGGTLTPDGVVKKSDTAIEFHLVAADGSFVDAVSQDNYNMCVVPNNTDFTKYQSSMPGTGRFMMKSYTTNVGAVFVRNPHYWGTAALPSQVQVTYYASEEANTAALASGGIDCDDAFTVSTSPELLSGNYNLVTLKGSLHRELSMRCDMPNFSNKYVRQAVALTLNRPEIVQALFKGYAQIGNDSPFAPVFKATNTSVPQRVQNISMAKQLMAKAGMANGFKTPLYGETTGEMPHFAEIVASSVKNIGIDVSLIIETPTKYYGDAVFGKSDWLDGEMSLVDYGSRGVPNLFLKAPLQTINSTTGTGAWNAAHFSNSQYDKLSNEFIAAVDISTQQSLAGQIETLLLDETPIIYAYFYDLLIAQQKNVNGIYPTQLGLFFWYMTKS